MNINEPSTFGAVELSGGSGMVSIDQAPPPGDRKTPSVRRVFEGTGCNIILFRFCAGQRLKEHKAAHPITVQALSGEVHFAWEGQQAVLRPGSMLHLPAMVPHEVWAEADAVMALFMHTPH